MRYSIQGLFYITTIVNIGPIKKVLIVFAKLALTQEYAI